VVVGPWSLGDFESTGRFPISATWPRLTESAKQIPILAGLTAHPGIFLGIAAALLLTWILYRSRWGYEIRVIGNNPKAARYAGINVARNIILVMGLSGALAGLAGMNEVAAQRELNGRFQRGLGFTGVIVAWLARLNPIAAILVSILFRRIIGWDAVDSTSRHFLHVARRHPICGCGNGIAFSLSNKIGKDRSDFPARRGGIS